MSVATDRPTPPWATAVKPGVGIETRFRLRNALVAFSWAAGGKSPWSVDAALFVEAVTLQRQVPNLAQQLQ